MAWLTTSEEYLVVFINHNVFIFNVPMTDTEVIQIGHTLHNLPEYLLGQSLFKVFMLFKAFKQITRRSPHKLSFGCHHLLLFFTTQGRLRVLRESGWMQQRVLLTLPLGAVDLHHQIEIDIVLVRITVLNDVGMANMFEHINLHRNRSHLGVTDPGGRRHPLTHNELHRSFDARLTFIGWDDKSESSTAELLTQDVFFCKGGMKWMIHQGSSRNWYFFGVHGRGLANFHLKKKKKREREGGECILYEWD